MTLLDELEQLIQGLTQSGSRNDAVILTQDQIDSMSGDIRTTDWLPVNYSHIFGRPFIEAETLDTGTPITIHHDNGDQVAATFMGVLSQKGQIDSVCYRYTEPPNKPLTKAVMVTKRTIPSK